MFDKLYESQEGRQIAAHIVPWGHKDVTPQPVASFTNMV